MATAAQVDVLLIEDNPTDVLLTRENLGDAAVFRMQHAERLSKGVDLLTSRRFDVVLLDLGLPDSQGLSTLLKVRESSPLVPIVVMTGRDDEETALRAVHLGAQDYLVKNIVDEGALRRSIRYAIERNQSEGALRERATIASMNAEIGLAFTRGGAMAETLSHCAESLVSGLDATLVRIWTLDARSAVVELQASAGLLSAAGEASGNRASSHNLIETIMADRKALVIADVATAVEFAEAEWAMSHGFRSYAGFPLMLGDRPVGVLAIYSVREITKTVLDAAASVAHLIALGIERERAEQTLREVNRTLNSLVEAAPVAIVLLDPDGTVLGWNGTAERLFGWTSPEVLGKPFPMAAAEVGGAFDTLVSERSDGGHLSGVELQVRRKDCECIDVSLWTASIMNDEGAPVASLGIFVDIGHRKALEDQLRQAQKMEAIGILAGGVAHDFNNLLTIISGYSDMLRRKLLERGGESEMFELTSEIMRAGERAASLTRQLLAFSRKQVLEPKILSLNSLIINVEKLLARLIGEDVALESDLDPDLAQVRADAGQLEQVLMNLAVNARDAMPEGGKLTIETANVELNEALTSGVPDLQPGPYVKLSVRDTGVGMDEITRSHIFEPFFTTKEFGQGTGLGLATVYGIVRQSGGHVEVVSSPGSGSTFNVYLPRTEGAVTQTSRGAKLGESRGSESILLVEDDFALRSLTRRILEMHGYTVAEAANGEEALRLARSSTDPIHLLVTDVVMPLMGGSKLAELLSAERPGIRVLYISGYTDDAVIRHGILQSETAFLHKPFTPSAFAQKVREVLDQ